MATPITPIALITGITGQDGSYLAELLLEKNYIVHGIVRRTSSLERSRLKDVYEDHTIYNRRLFLHYADLEDNTALRRILQRVQPDELYHLAGQSHVGLSFEIPETTCELTAMATLRLLEILRDLPRIPKLLHASSSEIFGQPTTMPQTEESPINPATPYGCAKAFATQMVRIYREHFGVFAVNAISYNHESPRRGENFVSRKICRGAAEIKLGRRDSLELGNLDAKRDWSDARDVMNGAFLAMQYEQPEDFIFASGKLHSISDMLNTAFEAVSLDWREFVKVDEKLFRPADPTRLVGDPSKAERLLGWARNHDFDKLIESMVLAELQDVQAAKLQKRGAEMAIFGRRRSLDAVGSNDDVVEIIDFENRSPGDPNDGGRRSLSAVEPCGESLK